MLHQLHNNIRTCLSNISTGGFEVIFNQRVNDDTSMMLVAAKKKIERCTRLYRSKKYTRKYGNYTKEINLISGQFYFILLLLYFFNKIETKEMNEAIRYIYQERRFEANKFEILYTAALKRLYKEGMLIKNVENGLNYYKLSKKGYYAVKDLLNDVMVDNRDKLVNKIRLDIISAQYR